MNIVEATRSYERWLAEQIPLVQADLRLKHERMGESLLGFLRATYYRWAQRFSELLPELAAAPAVLAVGDLHLENFGTWRDRSGRIVWGVNDYDEAERLPYVRPEARELKQLSPPAGAWLGLSRIEADLTLHLGQHADPILARRGGWQRRRLAPECRKLDLAAYGGKQEQHILHAMGYQTASAHLAVNPASRDAITEHVTRFTAGDLREAIEEMARHFAHDHTDYSHSKGR